MNQQLPAYVMQADEDFVAVYLGSQAVSNQLGDLGFSPDLGRKAISTPAPSKAEKAKVLSKLRDLGFPFARGHEWNPAEIFEWLRDEGLIAGPFTEIYWTDPDSWHTRDCV